MPVPKNKPITSSPEGSTPESSSPTALDQEEFRQHLRRLAVSAVQVLLEQVMREELEQCLGASWGECTPTRRGYRNGFYTRDLVTPTGRMEDLKVPRDRDSQFHSQVFERYNRYEPEVAEALTQAPSQESQALCSSQLGGLALSFPVLSHPGARGHRSCVCACVIPTDPHTTLGMVSYFVLLCGAYK